MENSMKYILLTILLSSIASFAAFSQQENDLLAEGNRLYKEGKYEEAIPYYKKALEANSSNLTALYNLSAVLSKTGKPEDAEKGFETIAKNGNDKSLLQKSHYNQGVMLSRQKKLEESIAAYKKALSLDPTDEDSRFNLQKALEELRQKQPQKKNEQDKKDKKQEQQQTPPANKKQMEQWLQSLRQKEQEVQKKMQQNRSRANKQPEKDW